MTEIEQCVRAAFKQCASFQFEVIGSSDSTLQWLELRIFTAGDDSEVVLCRRFPLAEVLNENPPGSMIHDLLAPTRGNGVLSESGYVRRYGKNSGDSITWNPAGDDDDEGEEWKRGVRND